MKRNAFGQPLWVKRSLIRIFGAASWPRFNWKYEAEIEGAEVFQEVRDKNVLIVSNHQTYFADVTFMFHVIQSAIAGKPNNIHFPGFLLAKKTNIYFVAAEETMSKGFLPKLMRAGGAITVKRTWRKDGENTKREVDPKDPEKVVTALNDGWVISFPQGTTTPFVQGRKGTAHLIKQTEAVVVPVVIDGFRRAFDKKGLVKKKKGTTLRMQVKEPLKINFDAPVDDILHQIMDAIEQTEDFLMVK
ncbi:MAG: 1-acyl-sn-glycerol-3-phosphate acyltransferase [Flavobacteriales bacterium]|nr:1-acyl-sn-glycerol-3-phosphate acyltransferase [Flavobacteriales bacterium]